MTVAFSGVLNKTVRSGFLYIFFLLPFFLMYIFSYDTIIRNNLRLFSILS